MPREALAKWGWYTQHVHYVYILRLSDGSYYIGFSTDLKQRIESHAWGEAESTKNFLPVKLVFYAAFSTQQLATKFEKYLKSSSGFAFRNKRLV
ncbi:hypothetical protein A2721_03100 [Candidatus Gottesmanbacteria bacterium RIFCSPHIGHO2_01_FULL_47_48]|uniref:GIY-YIG domain-containing protein n=1 Tax=Candidatus Gottesmanbacteria bacterium RIFCSPHIGHO2_01_FULL_47_48 TaxID=1798381 RepID=A0A1F5ZYV9_9BACT|nr:MAG: hypothetical protein A2721_03100 [Candidatus Gottesmanbacteria bacterium RIFCSPHIGHO2_01_FULL_47_48]